MIKWVLVAILKGSVAVNVPGMGVGYEYPMARSYGVHDTEKDCERAKRAWWAENRERAYRVDCLRVELTRGQP